MQDCLERASKITAHIPNTRVQQRVTKNIASFLAKLDEICSLGDETTNDSKEDAEDTIEKIVARQAEKIEKIKSVNSTPDADESDEDVGSVVTTVSSDIDEEVNNFGYTALIKAAVDGNLELVKTLLAQGANPNCVDTSDMTALDKALNAGYDEIAALLTPLTLSFN